MKKIFLFILIYFTSHAQNWNSKFLIKDTLQGGEYPSAAIDTAGNIHITYWNKFEDKLIYVRYSPSTGNLIRNYVFTDRNGGFPNKIFISDSGKIYCAFMENVGGYMQPRFAKLINNQWIVENVSNRNFGKYGPIYRTQPLWINPSIDLYVNEPKNQILLAMFNANYSIADYKYDFQLYLGYKTSSGWNVGTLPNIPTWAIIPEATQQEGIAGERFGEFCNIVYDSINFYSVYTVGTVSGNLLKLSGSYADTLNWNYSILDSVLRIDPTLSNQQRFWATFQGLNSQKKDSILHLVYSTMEKDLRNVYINTDFHSLIYRKYDVKNNNSVLTNFIIPTNSNDLILDPCVAIYNKDTILVSLCNYSQNAYYLAYSYNGGITWNTNLLYPTTTPFAPAPIVFKDTSVFITLFDASKEKLITIETSVNNPATILNIKQITYNTDYTSNFAAEIKTQEKYSVILQERILNRFLFLDKDTILPVDVQGKSYYDISIDTDSNITYITYTDGITGFVKLATLINNTPIVEVVDFAAQASQSDVMHYNNRTYCGYVSNSGLHFAEKNGIWNYLFVDSSGFFPEIITYKGLPAVAYYNYDSSEYLLATLQNNSWTKVGITPNNITPSFGKNYSILNDNDTLLFAFQTYDNLIYFSSKEPDSSWQNEIVVNTEIGIIGTRIAINKDSLGRPWVIYSVLNDVERLAISVKINENTWYSVFVPYPLSPEFYSQIYNDKLLIISKYVEGDSLRAISLTTLDSVSKISAIAPSSITYKLPDIKLYPNPCTEKFFIETSEPILSINMYNVEGKKVPINIQKNNNTLEIKAETSAGIYFLILKTPNGIISKKIVFI